MNRQFERLRRNVRSGRAFVFPAGEFESIHRAISNAARRVVTKLAPAIRAISELQDYRGFRADMMRGLSASLALPAYITSQAGRDVGSCLGVASAPVHKTIRKFEFETYLLDAGLDPGRTNQHVVDRLFSGYESKTPGLVIDSVPMRSGVSTLVRKFAEFMPAGNVAVLSRMRRNRRNFYHHWRETFRGFQPRPRIIVVDNPLTSTELRSVSTVATFDAHLKELAEMFTLYFPEQRHNYFS